MKPIDKKIDKDVKKGKVPQPIEDLPSEWSKEDRDEDESASPTLANWTKTRRNSRTLKLSRTSLATLVASGNGLTELPQCVDVPGNRFADVPLCFLKRLPSRYAARQIGYIGRPIGLGMFEHHGIFSTHRVPSFVVQDLPRLSDQPPALRCCIDRHPQPLSVGFSQVREQSCGIFMEVYEGRRLPIEDPVASALECLPVSDARRASAQSRSVRLRLVLHKSFSFILYYSSNLPLTAIRIIRIIETNV